MSMYRKNIDFLKQRAANFFPGLTNDEFRHPQLQVVEENNGPLRLQLGDRHCYLHSAYDLEREMQKLFGPADLADNEEQTLVIFGLGMGHCLEYLAKHQIGYRRVHIIEPFDNIFKILLDRRDLSTLLCLNNLSINLIKEPQEMSKFVWEQISSIANLKLLYHLSYRSIFAEFFDEAGRYFVEKSNDIRSAIVTEDRQVHIWAAHQLKNLKKQMPRADLLYNKFTGIPAVIVSAGPSLERHFDLLKEIGNRALIIAPGTGARVLDQRGIGAHLVMATDSAAGEADIFKDYQGTCPLIGSFRLHPRLDEEFPNAILWLATSSDRLVQYYYRHFLNESLAVINDHPSVSNCAIDYAFMLGCNPIILVGQDLCFYNNQLHADEEAASLPVYNGKPYQRIDINGLPVTTTNIFLSMKHEFEAQTQQYGARVQIINATEAGLGISGVADRCFEDVIKEYIEPQTSDVAATIAATIAQLTTGNNDDNRQLAGFYDHILDQIAFIEHKNQDKLTLLKKLEKLQKRRLKATRLQNCLALIAEINTELEGNAFYKDVIRAGLGSVIQYYLLAVQCNFGSIEQSPEAYKTSETFFIEITTRYSGYIKNMVNTEKGKLVEAT